METTTVAEKLKEIIIEVKGGEINIASIENSTNLMTEIGIDSLQLINLLLSIEDEFSVEIDFDTFDISHLDSFEKFCTFITSCINKKEDFSEKTDMLFCELTTNSETEMSEKI
jgi:acyl carrier protein